MATLSAVFYGVSPLDLIPDLVPLLGFVDDAVAVPVLLVMAFVWYRNGRMTRQPAHVPIAPPIERQKTLP